MTIRRLTLNEAEFIAHRLAYELMNSTDEPIPPFNTTDMNKLDSSLYAPFHTYDGKYLYRTFIERASLLFYLITKNHCFGNGNKRMAVTLTTVFCFVNRRWLNISAIELYDLACGVADSEAGNKDEVLESLNRLFKQHIAPIQKEYIIDKRRKVATKS